MSATAGGVAAGEVAGPEVGAPGLTVARLAGVGLVLLPLAFNLFFALLAATFEYPEVLRHPPGEVLQRFRAGGPGLVAVWYGFALTALLLCPLSVLLARALAGPGGRPGGTLLALGATTGVLAGLVQFLGLARWPFLVPFLAETYADPGAGAATREATAVVYEAFNRYLGAGLGEHTGYLLTGAWTLLVGAALVASPALPGRLARVLAWAAVPPALGVMAGMLEPAGWGPAGAVNAVAYILWSLWLLALGVSLLRSGRPRRAAPAAAG